MRLAFNANAYRFKRKSSNELLTCNEFVSYLWQQSVYKTTYKKKGDNYQVFKPGQFYWVEKKLNFFATHNGYYFKEANKYSAKHEKDIHDMSTLQADEAYNQAFSMALKAYTGGQNLCYNS